MPTTTDTPSVLFNALAEEAKRVFMSYTVMEHEGERWTLSLEEAVYYAARAKIDSNDEARVMLVEMIKAFPDWEIFSRPSFEMIGEASGWMNLAQDLFTAFCTEILEQDPAVKPEMEKRSRQPERTQRELARIKGVLKLKI
jgi:hypothetical protein